MFCSAGFDSSRVLWVAKRGVRRPFSLVVACVNVISFFFSFLFSFSFFFFPTSFFSFVHFVQQLLEATTTSRLMEAKGAQKIKKIPRLPGVWSLSSLESHQVCPFVHVLHLEDREIAAELEELGVEVETFFLLHGLPH